MTRRKVFPSGATFSELLKPMFENGKRIYRPQPVKEIRERVQQQLQTLHESIKRFVNPHLYPVGLEEKLSNLKTELILQNRGFKK
jgi:nicotinate phosphoribosyltransferase